jgi:hypothetical protein
MQAHSRPGLTMYTMWCAVRVSSPPVMA